MSSYLLETFAFIGAFDLGIPLFIQQAEPVRGAFRRRGFQVENIPGAVLDVRDNIPHEIHGFGGKGLPIGTGDVLSQKIEAGFVHADNANGRKMVFPEEAAVFLDLPQVELGVGIQVLVRECFQDFTFDRQAFNRQPYPWPKGP